MQPLGPTIALSGPTGSGKTSLARELESRGESVVFERICDSDQEPPRFGLQQMRLQREAIRAKAEALARREGQAATYVDRSLAEDRDIFLVIHRERGHLTTRQFEELACMSYFSNGESEVDAVVILTAPTALLGQRLRDRGAPSWLIESLALQVALYQAWPATIDRPKLWLDSSVNSLGHLADQVQLFAGEVTSTGV